MTRFRSRAAWTLVSAAVLLAGQPGLAQTARSGAGASAQLLQQMQQLASERTTLQAENTRMKKELEDTRKERDALKSVHQALDRRARVSEASLKESLTRSESTAQELAQTKDKLQQLIGKFRETAQTLRDVETDRTVAKQTLATRDQEYRVCVDRNLELYKLNQEVLTRLEKQGLFTRVARAEPFTKIKRVQLENLVDEYRARADDQRVKTQAPPPAAPATPPASQAVTAPPPTASSHPDEH